MSLNAIIWALEQAPVEDPTTALVLIALADNANNDGTGSWPAVQTIALRARCSPRTAQRHLRDLEAANIIRKGNQDLVAGYRADRRPTVYDLNLRAVRGDNLTPRPTERGVTGGTDGVSPVTERGVTGVTQTVLEPTHKPPQDTPALFAVPPQPLEVELEGDGFDQFWAVYPRKIAKGDARKAWAAAVKAAKGPNLIIMGAEKYAADPTRTPQFTAYPATWLRAQRWDDEGPAGSSRQGGTMNGQDRTAHHDHWTKGGSFA